MTSIDFYFNAEDRLQVACRLAGKALAQRKRMLMYAPDSELAGRIDRMLWVSPAIGFVPHCAAHDPLAPDTPLLIGAGELPEALGCDVILNLAADEAIDEGAHRALGLGAHESIERPAVAEGIDRR